MKHLVWNICCCLLTISSFSWISTNVFFVTQFNTGQPLKIISHNVLLQGRSHARCILLVGTGFDSSPSSRIFSVQSSLYCLCWLDEAHICLLQVPLWDSDFSRECTKFTKCEFTAHFKLFYWPWMYQGSGSLFPLEALSFGDYLLVRG